MNIEGKRILITGGSSGIGLALADAMASRGARLLLAGRHEARLLAAAADLRTRTRSTVDVVTGDVADAQARERWLKAAQSALGGLDILVNNAGAVRAGRLESMSEEDIRAMIEVDLLGPILLTRAALPALRASGDAMVVNIASGIALTGVPFYAAYAGAKAGLARFGEALRRELSGEGVHVMTAYPGATDTPMMRSNEAGPELGFTRESAADVATAIVAGIEAGAFDVIRGGEARLKMLELNRSDPGALDVRFNGMKKALEAAVRNHSAM